MTLTGEVLIAQEPRRLSYSLQAGQGQPATYVTWAIPGTSTGCVVRLYVDEPGEPVGSEADLETESGLAARPGRARGGPRVLRSRSALMAGWT